MRKPLLAVALIIIIVMAQLIATAPVPPKSLRAQLNPNYLRAMAAYRKLEPRLPRDELRAITTIGILNGARQAEQQMESHLIEIVKDLLLNTDINDRDNIMPKIVQIEKQLTRDHRAIEILNSAMDLAIGVKDVAGFKEDMQHKLQQIRRQENLNVGGSVHNANSNDAANENDAANIGERIARLRRHILEQVNTMKSTMEQKIEHTLDYLIDEADENGLLARASNKVVRKRDASEEPAEIRMIKSILTEDDFHNNLVDNRIVKRGDTIDSLEDIDLELDTRSNSKNDNQTTAAETGKTTASDNTTSAAVPAKQEAGGSAETTNDSDELPAGGGGGGGGLVGLIAGLSGGEGGSDIGALIGALTGVVSTLFGPMGLDIESLISTATSLISGLLSGNKNFGTVLGNYVGLALDGLSGGGGAINNGQFIGNFLGTVVAALSADPEEDDAPLRPVVFAQNLISSFFEAKNRKASEEVTEERKADYGTNQHHKEGGGGAAAGGGGSDSAGFIKHIVSHLVGSALSLILNASLGASGGASHASHSLFSASSSGHKPAAGGGGVKSW